MSKIFLLIFSFISFNTAFAIDIGELRCSKAGTIVLFVNGIMNSDTMARASSTDLIFLKHNETELMNKIDSSNDAYVTFFYNYSLNILADLFESASQKLAQEGGVENSVGYAAMHALISGYPARILRTLNLAMSQEEIEDFFLPYVERLSNLEASTTTELTDKIVRFLAADKKILFVSHSQGNLFANSAYIEMNSQNALIKNNRRFAEYLESIEIYKLQLQLIRFCYRAVM